MLPFWQCIIGLRMVHNLLYTKEQGGRTRICNFLYEIHYHTHYISNNIYKTKALFSNLWPGYYLYALFLVWNKSTSSNVDILFLITRLFNNYFCKKNP